MSSQETIEDPTLYQDRYAANDSFQSIGAAEIVGSPYSASHTSQSEPEIKKTSHDNKEDNGYMRGTPCATLDCSPVPELAHVLLLVTQLHFKLTQMKERMEDTVNSVSCIMKHLEKRKDLAGDLGNDVNNMKDPTQKCRQEKGILRRAQEERNDGYRLVGGTPREKKRARVAWED